MNLARKVWRKIVLRGLTASDNHAQLDRLYAMPDPWNMAAAREQQRFAMTNALIAAKLPEIGTMLEVGCGEGHQSERLVELCGRLHGIDVSPRAVMRARERVPEARFDVGTLESMPAEPSDGGFDLVVACEVLYYMRDPRRAVQRMSELGRACLVTFFGPAARVVAPHLDHIEGVERGWFYHDPYTWLWAYWRRPEGRRAAGAG